MNSYPFLNGWGGGGAGGSCEAYVPGMWQGVRMIQCLGG
jgi:hypothetical protein